MNETLKIEQAYYRAIGVASLYKDYPEDGYDCLVDLRGNQLEGILFSDVQGYRVMRREEINVEFYPDRVYAWHPDGTTGIHVYYTDEQWKSKLWVLNSAIVQAATQKLERNIV
jgi:hypothetical protein